MQLPPTQQPPFDPSITVSIRSAPGSSSVEIVDPIERNRVTLEAGRDVSLIPADPETFVFPVESAVSFSTTYLSIPRVVVIYARRPDGELLFEAEQQAHESLPPGQYVLDICTAIKLYLEVTGAVTLESDFETMELWFEEGAELALGARSAHDHPEAHLTTTRDPEDVAVALSALSSALKTTSPERSFPTLRGHPPTVGVGESLAIPAHIDPPETGIELGVHPSMADLLPVGSVAYYLGATVVPDSTRELRLEGDTALELGVDRPFEADLDRLLKRVFLLDCIVRTEGLYPVRLAEREAFETKGGLDIAELYNRPIASRLEAYLEIPYPHIEDLLPRWGRTAFLRGEPGDIEILPYLVNDLATIHVTDPPEASVSISSAGSAREDRSEPRRPTTQRMVTNSDTLPVLALPESDARERIWYGEGMPINATKVTKAAFENRLERSPSTDDISVTVICNDYAMNAEFSQLDDIYGTDRDLPFELTTYSDLTCNELETVLADRSDFLHYIGHIREDGFECPDGKLDVGTIEEVNVDAFLLNACRSHHQGLQLVRAGSIGGIVTLGDIVNVGAGWIGQTLARLLNLGFPLYAALEISRPESLMGKQYTIVGDGRVELVQPASIPQFFDLAAIGPDVEFSSDTFPTSRIDIGSMYTHLIGENMLHHLVSRTTEHESVNMRDFREFLKLENRPTRFRGSLTWSQELHNLEDASQR